MEPLDHGQHLIESGPEPPGEDDAPDGPDGDGPDEDGPASPQDPIDPDLESLRSEFVAAFNARDLEVILSLVAADVECPDRRTSGAAELAAELVGIWNRSPGALLTDALLDGTPCAVAWVPDEDGCWSRAALVCIDGEEGLVQTFELPDDADALARAETDDPEGEELDEGLDWVEWDTGEMPVAGHRR